MAASVPTPGFGSASLRFHGDCAFSGSAFYLSSETISETVRTMTAHRSVDGTRPFEITRDLDESLFGETGPNFASDTAH